MHKNDLVETYPFLYHMAHQDAWEGIRRHGLLSTSALLDLFEISGAQREAIESARRPESCLIRHPEHGTAIIRDNKPISDSKLRACLHEDTSPAEFYRLLNGC